jgi:hypothetical protein
MNVVVPMLVVAGALVAQVSLSMIVGATLHRHSEGLPSPQLVPVPVRSTTPRARRP